MCIYLSLLLLLLSLSLLLSLLYIYILSCASTHPFYWSHSFCITMKPPIIAYYNHVFRWLHLNVYRLAINHGWLGNHKWWIVQQTMFEHRRVYPCISHIPWIPLYHYKIPSNKRDTSPPKKNCRPWALHHLGCHPSVWPKRSGPPSCGCSTRCPARWMLRRGVQGDRR